MAGKRRKVLKHPVWETMLLMAAGADETGLTEADARALLKRWMPSMAQYVDVVLAEMGEAPMLPEDAMEATFNAINREEPAMVRAQFDRALAGETEQGTPATANTDDGDFSARLRREIGAKRDASGRATVEMEG